jgi:hypothetical protein
LESKHGLDISTETFYRIKLIRTNVGEEKPLVKKLKEKDSNARYFKVLGDYDILEFSSLLDMSNLSRVNADSRILSYSSIPCLSIRDREEELIQNIKSIKLTFSDTAKNTS